RGAGQRGHRGRHAADHRARRQFRRRERFHPRGALFAQPMIARHTALWALTASLLAAQSLESFTRLARPGETFFGGEWAAAGEQPSARFAQGNGAFEIKGSTNDSRNYVDIYHT